MMVLVAILVASCFVALVTEYCGSRLYQRAALVAFPGHLFVSLFVIPLLPYQWDIPEFHRTATAIARGIPPSTSTTVNSFGGFQGLLYAVFASNPGVLGGFNGLFAVLLPIPVSYLASRLYTRIDREPPGAVLATLFLPLPFLFLSIPMRDTLTVLSFLTLLAVILRGFRAGSVVRSLPGVPLWGMVYLLRPELALVVVLGAVAAVTVVALRAVSPDLSLSSVALVFGGIGLLGFGLFAEVLYSFERANSALTHRTRGGAVYLEGMEYGSWFDFLLAAPARALYFQFAPFPLHIEMIFHLLGLLATLFVIVLFVSGFRSLANCELDETTAVFLGVVYVAGIVGYGAINANFGTNVRHRMTFDFLLVVFASPVLQQWWLRVRARVGVVPGQRGHDDEQQRETQELDRGAHGGRQHANETQ